MFVGDDDGADITLHDSTAVVEIQDGDDSPSTLDGSDFGSVFDSTITKDFVIGNNGAADLTFAADAITFSGANPGDFVAVTQPVGPIANGASETITIRFEPTTAGPRNAIVEIVNSDSSESPFRFAITATAYQKIVVTTLSDEDNGTPDPSAGDGEGLSLREAIDWANIAPGQDVICFQDGLAGVAYLSDRLPTITDALTIDGNTDSNVGSNEITINGSLSYRVFRVDDADLSLSNIHIEAGYADGAGGSGLNGGAIWANHSTNAPLLSLSHVSLAQNAAQSGGALFQQNGQLSASDSVGMCTYSVVRRTERGRKCADFSSSSMPPSPVRGIDPKGSLGFQIINTIWASTGYRSQSCWCRQDGGWETLDENTEVTPP